MSILDLEKLVNLKKCSGGHRAACPACRAEGGDKKGEHLFVGDSYYGCAANQGDKEHRSLIFQYVGKPSDKVSQRAGRYRSQACRRRERQKRNCGESPLVRAASKILPEILAQSSPRDWRASLKRESHVVLDSSSGRDWATMLKCLFPMSSNVFIGDIFNSGEERGKGHFRRVSEWLTFTSLPGPRTTASTFPEGNLLRKKECVLERLYLIIESDDLIGRSPKNAKECEENKAASVALFQWLRNELGMQLGAVVDTGHRSLHGWFKMPERTELFSELLEIAPSLRIDPNLFHQPNAPVRLPGCIHKKTRNPAQLLFVDQMI